MSARRRPRAITPNHALLGVMRCPTGKVAYLSSSAAHSAQRRLLSELGRRVDVYRCPGCLAWHVTHHRPARHRRRERDVYGNAP